MFEPRNIDAQRRLSPRQRIVVFVMNFLLLAELTVAMYRGQHAGDELTEVFLWTFLPLAAFTLIATRIVLRKLQPVEVAPPVTAACRE
jgi:hypothetical protein